VIDVRKSRLRLGKNREKTKKREAKQGITGGKRYGKPEGRKNPRFRSERMRPLFQSDIMRVLREEKVRLVGERMQWFFQKCRF